MKKFIVSSICTLVLSLLGAFGVNQNVVNKNTNSIPAEVTESATNITDKNNNTPSKKPTPTDRVTDKPSATPAAKPTDKPSATPTGKPSATPTAKPTDKPTATPAPSAAPTNSTTASRYAEEVLRLVNIEREKAGLSAYTTNTTLTSAANKRAGEIKKSFSHTRPDGSSFYTVLKEYNVSYRTAGENIAYGQKTPEEVVKGWMNSPGHRANILKPDFHKLGIGVYEVNGVYYWTQLFTD